MVEDAPGRDEAISWLELFFDLVVVAAVAVLTDGLVEGPSLGALGLVVVTYGTIWLSWIRVVLYANVASAQTRTRVVVTAMLLIAVMTASVPVHHEGHANLFAGAFLVLRGTVAGNARETGRLLGSIPLFEFGGASLPWIASLWVHAPAKHWVWAVALAIDLAFLAANHEITQEDLQRMRPRGGRRPEPGQMVVVDVDRAHLDERLGLFVIIVLGESVTQLVVAAASREWDRPFAVTALASFALLVSLWWLTFKRAEQGMAKLPPRLVLPLHGLSTLGLVAVAAGIAALVTTSGDLPAELRWALCGGLSLHLGVTAAFTRDRGALLAVAVPVVVGAAVPGASHPALALLMLVPVALLVWPDAGNGGA